MTPSQDSLFEALAEAAESGRGLSQEWLELLEREPKLREAAERFDQVGSVLSGLTSLKAPKELEGRVVGAMQAGHREDRAVESLRGLSTQTAPPELEALVAESMPGATQLNAPAELDRRVEAILRDWEVEEDKDHVASDQEPQRRRFVLVGQVAAAASVLFLVVLAAPGKTDHEEERDRLVQSVEVSERNAPAQAGLTPGEQVLSGMISGPVELAAPKRRAAKAPTKPQRPQGPRGNQRRSAASSNRALGGQGGNQSATAGTPASAQRMGADLLTQLSSPNVISHQGDRLVRLPVGPDSPMVLIYREHVAVTSDGQFSIEPIEVLQPQMAPSTEETFQALQKSRESFFHRYRGFKIRDLALFTEHYTTSQSSSTEAVCGIDCVVLDVDPNEEGAHSYRLWIDPQSGLCLRTQERDEAGHLLCEVEYENIEFAPALASELSGGPSVWEPVADSATTRVPAPLWVPESYVFEEAEIYTDASGDEWTRLRYTDGVEPLMILRGNEQATAQAPTTGPAKSALTRVFVHRVGAWTVVEGYAKDQHFVVMGKRPEADLIATLASLVY